MVPLIYKVPEPVNVTTSLTSFIVILPFTVTTPVDKVIPEFRLALPVAVTVIEPLVKEPVPTLINLLSPAPVPAPIVTPFVTVRLLVPDIVIMFGWFPELIVKELQTAAVFIVTLKLFGITTL